MWRKPGLKKVELSRERGGSRLVYPASGSFVHDAPALCVSRCGQRVNSSTVPWHLARHAPPDSARDHDGKGAAPSLACMLEAYFVGPSCNFCRAILSGESDEHKLQENEYMDMKAYVYNATSVVWSTCPCAHIHLTGALIHAEFFDPGCTRAESLLHPPRSCLSGAFRTVKLRSVVTMTPSISPAIVERSSKEQSMRLSSVPVSR